MNDSRKVCEKCRKHAKSIISDWKKLTPTQKYKNNLQQQKSYDPSENWQTNDVCLFFIFKVVVIIFFISSQTKYIHCV